MTFLVRETALTTSLSPTPTLTSLPRTTERYPTTIVAQSTDDSKLNVFFSTYGASLSSPAGEAPPTPGHTYSILRAGTLPAPEDACTMHLHRPDGSTALWAGCVNRYSTISMQADFSAFATMPIVFSDVFEAHDRSNWGLSSNFLDADVQVAGNMYTAFLDQGGASIKALKGATRRLFTNIPNETADGIVIFSAQSGADAPVLVKTSGYDGQIFINAYWRESAKTARIALGGSGTITSDIVLGGCEVSIECAYIVYSPPVELGQARHWQLARFGGSEQVISYPLNVETNALAVENNGTTDFRPQIAVNRALASSVIAVRFDEVHLFSSGDLLVFYDLGRHGLYVFSDTGERLAYRADN